MITFKNNKCGISFVEYMALILFLIGALVVMRPYISNAINGYWKKGGDSFASGRRFDYKRTSECNYGQIDANNGLWYDATCYQQAVSSKCAPMDRACEVEQMRSCATAFCSEGH